MIQQPTERQIYQMQTTKECENHDCYKIGRYRGNDITFLPMENLDYSIEKCQEECQELDNCVVFTVSSENCFLKHDKNELEDESNANYISGKVVERIGTI